MRVSAHWHSRPRKLRQDPEGAKCEGNGEVSAGTRRGDLRYPRYSRSWWTSRGRRGCDTWGREWYEFEERPGPGPKLTFGGGHLHHCALGGQGQIGRAVVE